MVFIKARPCMARFKLRIAISKHREFVAEVLNRTGIPLRQGMFELHQHNSLLSVEDSIEFLDNWKKLRHNNTLNNLSDKEAWIVSQYHLLLAFPFLSAWEQAEILLSDEMDDGILLNMRRVLKPLKEEEFDRLLSGACSENDEQKQWILLMIANYTSVLLSSYAKGVIEKLFLSESKRVRAQAMGIIANSDDEDLLSRFAASDWSAMDIDAEEDSAEAIDGSMAILKAATKGIVAHDNTLKRISPRLYGKAAKMLDLSTVRELAKRIDASINHALELNDDIAVPDIELQIHSSEPIEKSMYNVKERQSESSDLKQKFEGFLESKEDFEQRQRRTHEAFLNFKNNLAREKALIILNYISLEEFKKMVEADDVLANRWFHLFLSISEEKLSKVYNIAYLLVHAFAINFPDKAKDLFSRLERSKPLVRFTFYGTGIQLDATAIWAGERNDAIDKFRFERLDYARNDYELFLEVLAALRNDQQELLKEYIEEKLNKEEPVEICRGIMVAGFSDHDEYNDRVLKRYESSSGMIGNAQKAAKYAYERNVWARYWFEKMCQTDCNSDFWRYSVLFLKIVDERFVVWNKSYNKEKTLFLEFWPSVSDDKIRHRFEKWRKKRKDKLFGDNAPAPIFLSGVL